MTTKIKNLDNIKELLKTRKQKFSALVDADGCLCIEGVFAVAWGWEIETLNHSSVLKSGGKVRADFLWPSDYRDTGIPSQVQTVDVSNLDLSEDQSKRLRAFNGINSLQWPILNDNIGLTFDQFSQLLDIIESKA